MRVVFRVDASRRIGTGHMVRCLTLASVLRDRGAAVSFVSRPHEGHLLEAVTRAEFAVSVLPGPEASSSADEDGRFAWLGTSETDDAAQTVALLGKRRPDWLVVDHYAIDAGWESVVRPHVGKILAIDDLADRKHACDGLLDQNYSPEGRARYDGLVPADCRLLLGPGFALLRPEYHEYRRTQRTAVSPICRVFVFFGGTDAPGATKMALEALSTPGLAHMNLHVVVGANYSDRAELEDLAARRGNTIIEGPRPHLADLMARSHLAIGAGGTTTWERMSLGLPSIVVSLAENQRPLCQRLGEAGLIHYLGNVECVSREVIAAEVEALIGDEPRLAEMRAASMRLVDGMGAPRVADVMEGDGGGHED